MLYKDAIDKIKSRMEFLLKDNDLPDYSLILKKEKSGNAKGEHDFDEKVIIINTSSLFIIPSKHPKQISIPKLDIPQQLLDFILITQCHETVHAKDFSFPLERFESAEERERFTLEDIACANPIFYGVESASFSQPSNYHRISFEARAFTQSVTMARDFLLNHDGLSLDEANNRIVEALNYKISEKSVLHVNRPNPDYDPQWYLKPNHNPSSKNKYLDDVSFHSFDEVIVESKKLMNKSDNHDWSSRIFGNKAIGTFPLDLDPKKRKEIEEINKEIEDLGFTNDFYETLSPRDRLYLNASITLKFYDRYKEIVPDARNIKERFEQYKELGFLDTSRLDLEYFNKKLQIFLKINSKLKPEQTKEHQLEIKRSKFNTLQQIQKEIDRGRR